MLPSVSVVTASTNSYSRGYLAYLATIESWTEVVDEVVIVDGGTDDCSYEILKKWVPRSNYRILCPIEARWPMGQLWHAGQWAINTHIGLNSVQTDWAVIICSDYVLDRTSAGGLRNELNSLHDQPGAYFRRYKLDRFGRPYLTELRGVALNLKYLRAKNRAFGYGVASRIGHLSDFPIYHDEMGSFLDPALGNKRYVFKGEWIPLRVELVFRCFVYGHYFMTAEQLIGKLCSFSWVYDTRYAGFAPKSPDFLRKAFLLNGQNLIRSRDVELSKPHLEAIKNVIAHHYSPMMLGHDGGQKRNIGGLEGVLLRGSRAISRTLFSWRRFPAVLGIQKWSKDEDAPLNILKLYKQQDTFLPKYMHLPAESDRASSVDREIRG